jgi:hypothetical protein
MGVSVVLGGPQGLRATLRIAFGAGDAVAYATEALSAYPFQIEIIRT